MLVVVVLILLSVCLVCSRLGKQEHRVSEEKTANQPDPRGSDFWDLPSSEKIQRVVVQPLAIADGAIRGKGKKRFTVRLVTQKQGVFELDTERAIMVHVFARGRQAALDLLSNELSGRPCFIHDSKKMTGKSGRWYDGNLVEMEILDQVSSTQESTASVAGS